MEGMEGGGGSLGRLCKLVVINYVMKIEVRMRG